MNIGRNSQKAFAVSLFEHMLGLYPPGFRRDFSDEIFAVFLERLEEARAQGRIAPVTMVLHEIIALALSILVERWHARSFRKGKSRTLNGRHSLIEELPVRKFLKIIPWILPLVLLGLGFISAHVLFIGLYQPWQGIGNPGENITQILGIRDGRKVLVKMQTGQVASYTFMDGEEVILPAQSGWQQEQDARVDPIVPLQYYGADFTSLPPLFTVTQLLDYQYIYQEEGKSEVKFALAADGDLWIWHHEIGGLTGIIYFYFPATGFVVGLVISLIFLVGKWLTRKSRSIKSGAI